MKTVYGVVSGSYSDYGVHFICVDEALATRIAGRMNHSGGIEYDVEEFTLVESDTDVVAETVYTVEVDKNGRVTNQWSYVHHLVGSQASHGETSSAYSAGARGCSVRGPAVALKAAHDALAQHKAKKAGV